MRTVQELLRIADEEKLFRSFDNRLAKHYFQNMHMPEDMTGKEYFDRRRKRFSDLYQRLTAIPIKEDEDGQHVLFAVPQLKDDLLGIEHSAELCKVEELLKDYRTAATYAYEFTEQEVIIGWFVAETDITLQHMYDLLTNILFEATFFGMEQEYLEEEMKKLEESAAEAKEMRAHPEKDTSRPADEVIEEMELKYGWISGKGVDKYNEFGGILPHNREEERFLDGEDDTTDRMMKAIYEKEHKLMNYIMLREKKKVLELLKADEQNFC